MSQEALFLRCVRTQLGAVAILAVIYIFIGVAVIALPSGIVTAAYIREITKKKGKNEL